MDLIESISEDFSTYSSSKTIQLVIGNCLVVFLSMVQNKALICLIKEIPFGVFRAFSFPLIVAK